MYTFLRPFVAAIALVFALSGCSDDSEVSSGGGTSLSSDGGANSAQYAGTYKGTTTVKYVGDDIDSNDSFPTTIVIREDGTVSVTIEGETVNGVINGNNLEIGVNITKTQDGITCDGDMLIKASVEGNSLGGPVSGDAECRLALIKRTATMTGSVAATKQ